MWVRYLEFEMQKMIILIGKYSYYFTIFIDSIGNTIDSFKNIKLLFM